MAYAILLLSISASLGPTIDPVGDVYFPGMPGTPASGTIPDLILGAALFDDDNGELRFEFTFTDNVYPADDYAHMDNQLLGYVDIDLDDPPVASGNSWKSQLSGYQSNLGIEAYIDLLTASSDDVALMDPTGALLARVPIAFDGPQLSITIPFADLDGLATSGDAITYAAYFYDLWQSTADVFPNNDGYLVVPEPVGLSVLGVGGLVLMLRRRQAWRRALVRTQTTTP